MPNYNEAQGVADLLSQCPSVRMSVPMGTLSIDKTMTGRRGSSRPPFSHEGGDETWRESPSNASSFDAEKYDLDYLRETRDSYSPITDADFEDSISYDMGEHDLRDLMEMDWRSNEKALDAFLGKSILVRYSPVNYDGGFVQFNLNDLDDLLHTYTLAAAPRGQGVGRGRPSFPLRQVSR